MLALPLENAEARLLFKSISRFAFGVYDTSRGCGRPKKKGVFQPTDMNNEPENNEK